MKFDFSLLLGKIRECGLTQEQLAKRAGMAPSNLNLKLHNKIKFRNDETYIIATILGIEDQIDEYFFVLK